MDLIRHTSKFLWLLVLVPVFFVANLSAAPNSNENYVWVAENHHKGKKSKDMQRMHRSEHGKRMAKHQGSRQMSPQMNASEIRKWSEIEHEMVDAKAELSALMSDENPSISALFAAAEKVHLVRQKNADLKFSVKKRNFVEADKEHQAKMFKRIVHSSLSRKGKEKGKRRHAKVMAHSGQHAMPKMKVMKRMQHKNGMMDKDVDVRVVKIGDGVPSQITINGEDIDLSNLQEMIKENVELNVGKGMMFVANQCDEEYKDAFVSLRKESEQSHSKLQHMQVDVKTEFKLAELEKNYTSRKLWDLMDEVRVEKSKSRVKMIRKAQSLASDMDREEAVKFAKMVIKNPGVVARCSGARMNHMMHALNAVRALNKN